jgi:hypothetical protein
MLNRLKALIPHFRGAEHPIPAAVPHDEVLFAGEDAVFRRVLPEARTYGEYGCGSSTFWVAKNMSCNILSVDSSLEWVQKVQHAVMGRENIVVHHANVGNVGHLGRPIDYSCADNFPEYTDWIWEQKHKPDVVLIDGRFRVCCFLTSLLRAETGTKIIFDDYENRNHYHVVERFIKPVSLETRQALFIVGDKRMLPLEEIEKYIRKFRYVFD